MARGTFGDCDEKIVLCSEIRHNMRLLLSRALTRCSRQTQCQRQKA